MTDFDIYTISDEYINTRLDKWVKKYYQGLKHNEIEIALRKNKIKVNKKKVKSNYRFQDFDQIEISIDFRLRYFCRPREEWWIKLMYFDASHIKFSIVINDISPNDGRL